jgi:hypothetical protein
MFVGHFALAFAAKARVPQVSLVGMFAAAQFADVLWPVLVATGIEQVRVAPGITAFTPLEFVSYPISHSLVAWGAAFGLLSALALLAGGVFTYARATRPRDAIGRRAFVGVAAFLVAGFVATALAPPPPSVQAVWIGAMAIALLTLELAHWVEQHRIIQEDLSSKALVICR